MIRTGGCETAGPTVEKPAAGRTFLCGGSNFFRSAPLFHPPHGSTASNPGETALIPALYKNLPANRRTESGRFQGGLGRPGGDISRADEVLVKGEQGFVDFEDVIIAPPDEVFHDDIELAGMGHGIARLA